MILLLSSVAGAAIVLALGLAAAAALRRRPAALRHAAIATAIGAALLMPALELLVPQLPVIRWFDGATVITSGPALVSDAAPVVAADRIAGAAAGVPWTSLLLGLWIVGAAATCTGLLTGLIRLARLRRGCAPAAGRWRELASALAGECGVTRPVALLQSDDPSLLVTCGVLRPAIILPAGASAWSDERRRIVLRHELAHIARHDALAQLGGEVLRIVHWMNPLVWIACRRLRQESEYACDDAVLNGGVAGADYATHLLEIARQLSTRHPAWAAAPAIAHPSTLERRISAMLHRHRNRAPLGRRGWAGAALVSLCFCIPLAAVGVGPSPATGSDVALVPPPAAGTSASASHAGVSAQGTAAIAGRVTDQSGGTLPGVTVTLTDPRTAEQVSTYTNASGRFTFSGLRPSAYDLAAQLAGFRTVSDAVTVAAGQSVERAITMPIGMLQETVMVRCTGPASAADAAAVGMPLRLTRMHRRLAGWIVGGIFPSVSAQEPVRVGGSIRAPKKIRDVKPSCPPGVPPGDTAVRLVGLIDTAGDVSELAVDPVDGAVVPADLAEAALDAVRHWRFTPTLLNGKPVEVDITVHITFSRS